MCQPHGIVSCNLSFTFWRHNLSPGQAPYIILFSIGKLNHLTYWSTKNWCQPHFLVSNKTENIRQHHFETNNGVYCWLCSFVCSIFQTQLEVKCWLMTDFEALLFSPYLRAFLPISRKQFLYFSLFDEI